MPAAPPSKERRRLFPLFVAIQSFVVLVLLVVLPACTQLTPKDIQDKKEVSRTALTVVQEACVMANAFFPRSKVADVCGIAGPTLQELDRLLASTRAAGAVRPRPHPVTCEETDAGIVCETPYRGDAGSP